jgi:hypothetical protein
MHALAVSTSGQTLPFWLQVTSIALAPLLGFTGVAIGVSLAERNRRNAYVTDERLKAYQDYLEASSQITNLFSPRFGSMIMGNHSIDDIEAFVQELMTLTEKTERAYMHLRLIGSPVANAMAHRIFAYVQSGGLLAKDAIHGQYSAESWSKLIDEGTHFQTFFIEAARRDLGLPRKEREMQFKRLIKEAGYDKSEAAKPTLETRKR